MWIAPLYYATITVYDFPFAGSITPRVTIKICNGTFIYFLFIYFPYFLLLPFAPWPPLFLFSTQAPLISSSLYCPSSMPPASRLHPSSAPSTPSRPRATEGVVDAPLFSSPTTPEPGRRRAVSSTTSPYPHGRQAIAAARTATRNEQRVRRVLAEIDWWTVMSGQRPDEEDDEQDEEEEEDLNLFVANPQHVIFDDDQVENESAGDHSMLAPSSLAPSSEDGSQFADDDCEDTATAHDEVR